MTEKNFISEGVRCKLRGKEGARCELLKKSIPSKEKSKCKGPVVGKGLWGIEEYA
jgi:hypothetical protein